MDFIWIGVAILLSLVFLFVLFVYMVYFRPLLEAYRMSKTVRSILLKLPLNKYSFNAQGLQDLKYDAVNVYSTSLTADERDFIDNVSLKVFKRIGKFIRK